MHFLVLCIDGGAFGSALEYDIRGDWKKKEEWRFGFKGSRKRTQSRRCSGCNLWTLCLYKESIYLAIMGLFVFLAHYGKKRIAEAQGEF